MDTGLLILRLGLALLLFGHGAQKMFGWFGGLGPSGTAPLFEKWGLRPGRPMVLLAATTEIIAAVLMAVGALTTLGAAMVIGAMSVAIAMTAANGLWAQKGGCELPLVYAGIGAVLVLTGAGRYSVDQVAGTPVPIGPGPLAIALVVGVGSGALVAAYAVRQRRGNRTAANS